MRQGVRAVVVSAFSGVTDQLIRMAREAESGSSAHTDQFRQLELRHLEAIRKLVHVHQQSNTTALVKLMLNELEDVLQGVQLIRECSPRTLDFVLGFGERLSAFIISRAFASADVPAEYLDARTVLRTNARFGAAMVDMPATTEALRTHFQAHPALQVVTGFIGSTAAGESTTLGRGGSDYTASILGAALGADEVHIWTDVDGVLTADPRKVPNAFLQAELSYVEAMEMSHFGAKVIYPPTIQPLMAAGIPIRIRNSFNPAHPGTKVTAQAAPDPHPIRGITSIPRVALLQVEGAGMAGVAGVAQRIFGAMARAGISVILISQASSEQSVCFAVAPGDAGAAVDALNAEFEFERQTGRIARIQVDDQQAILAVVGENMRHTPGISGRLFSALGQNGVNVTAIAQGSSELNISIVVPAADETKALRVIHDAFFTPISRTLHVFLIGLGRVGAELADLLHRSRATIAERNGLDLRLVGVANRSKMRFDLGGFGEDWRERLEQGGGPASVEAYLEHVLALNLPNSVVVDCTAGTEVNARYGDLLERSVAVVTPNKILNAGPMGEWRRLREISRRRQVPFLYETNVGAALPMVKTVRELAVSGDRFLKIEGVLSGTLSFLFNRFADGESFSSLLRTAFREGYTEPDPRDDLNGLDAARKILILAREAGWELELDDILIEPAVPAHLLETPTLDAFWDGLDEADKYLAKRRVEARNAGERLVYLASVEGGHARVGLTRIGPTHPAFHLQGTDNLLAITSDVYADRPLTVAGPGAGPVVTANGVLADLIRIGGVWS